MLFNRNEAYSRYKNSGNRGARAASGKRASSEYYKLSRTGGKLAAALLLKWTKLFIHLGTRLFLEIGAAWLELPACDPSLSRLRSCSKLAVETRSAERERDEGKTLERERDALITAYNLSRPTIRNTYDVDVLQTQRVILAISKIFVGIELAAVSAAWKTLN